MKISTLFLLALSALISPTIAFAQDAGSARVQPTFKTVEDQIYSESELFLKYYEMNSKDTRKVLNLVDDLYGRKMSVRSEEGGVPRRVRNLFELNGMVVVYETVKGSDTLLRALEEIDSVVSAAAKKEAMAKAAAANLLQSQKSMQGEPESSEIVTLSYSPRFLSANALEQSLGSFRRRVYIEELDDSQTETWSIWATDTPASIVIRDTQSNVDVILKRLAELDRAPHQVMLSAFLIAPSGYLKDQGTGVVPPALAKNLALLTPYESFDQLAMSSIRTNVSARDKTLLTLHRQPDLDYVIELQGLAYDAQSGCLSVGSASMKKKDGDKIVISMKTSFTAVDGEYAVLSLSHEGEMPLLLAVQFQSIPAANSTGNRDPK